MSRACCHIRGALVGGKPPVPHDCGDRCPGHFHRVRAPAVDLLAERDGHPARARELRAARKGVHGATDPGREDGHAGTLGREQSARAEISEIVNWPFMAAYLLGSAMTVVLALLVAWLVFGLRREEIAFHGYLSVFANTGYMGIPIFLTAFGTEGVLPVVVAILIVMTVL